MPDDEILTDDYVAGLLAQEARDCSLKFSAMGMEAFRSDKKPANLPKPNTRFLRHIIKDTDTHNKALLAKEAAESRARLQDMEHAKETRRLKTNPNARDITRRQMGDIRAILGGHKPRKPHGDDADTKGKGSGSRNSKDATAPRSSRQHHESPSKHHDDRRHHRERPSRAERGSSRDRSSRHDERRKSRDRRERNAVSGKDGNGDVSTHHHSQNRRDRNRSRSRSPHRRRRSRSPHEQRSRKHRRRSPIRDAPKSSADIAGARNDGSDSDPLDDLIGPAPPPRYRGRGTLGGAAGIDRRFSESYDPKTDVQMDEDEGGGGAGDWDDAVEAFRDRQKMRQNQEQRLQDAGFAPHQVAKMHQGEAARPDDGVTWSKAGEKREWDRGKEASGEDV